MYNDNKVDLNSVLAQSTCILVIRITQPFILQDKKKRKKKDHDILLSGCVHACIYLLHVYVCVCMGGALAVDMSRLRKKEMQRDRE